MQLGHWWESFIVDIYSCGFSLVCFFLHLVGFVMLCFSFISIKVTLNKVGIVLALQFLTCILFGLQLF